MTRAQINLERPVSLETAARKVAALRGHRGSEGGWIRTATGAPIVQGWHNYARTVTGTRGPVFESQERPGRFFVSVLFLSQTELERAELTGGRP